jgi:hypothetical protein
MNRNLCLSRIGWNTFGVNVYRPYLAFVFTLVFGVLITTPSFADKDLTNYATSFTENAASKHLTSATNFLMPNNGKAKSETITNCTDVNKFMDDGIPLYADTSARNDTLTICPSNQWQSVRIEFTKFDLAIGDSLHAYNGNLEALRNQNAPLIGKITGVGVSNAFGGWLNASCSPAINPSGCLTFVFETNGDLNKGTGWEAWANCTDKNIVLTPPSIPNPSLTCSEISKIQTIGAATLSSACGSISNDSTIVRIANASGHICIDTVLSKQQNMTISDRFAIGSYIVTYKLKSDTTKQATTYFTINEPSLVCNDQVSISIGSACEVMITPDMILEGPCDTIQNTLYYAITVKDLAGKTIAKGSGKAGDYPVLTKDQLTACNNTAYKVEISRIYYDGLTLPYCNNGRQAAQCNTTVNFIDNTPPLFTTAPSVDTVYACDINVSAGNILTTQPKAVDNCSNVAVNFLSTQKLSGGNDCKTEGTYLVSWKATDKCGNIAIRKDTLRVIRPGVDKIVKVPNAILNCGIDQSSAADNLHRTGVPGLMLGIQKNGVFKPTDTIALSTTEYVCNYILTKEDKEITASCGTKIFRYWTLVDWCANGVGPIAIDTQLVQFKDTLAPIIQCSAYNTLEKAEKIALPAFECTKKVNLPLPNAIDKCDLFPQVQMYVVERLEDGAWWKLGNNLNQVGALEADTFRVGYRAFDNCPEQIKEDSCYRYFILQDVTKPSATCQDLLNVSLSNDFARIRAVDINAGSWDACGIEKVLIRRALCGQPDVWKGAVNQYVKNRLGAPLDPTGWGDYIDFECCDLHQRIKVELLVIDNNGNYNFCWMEVEPEDKISPYCAPLPDAQDYCDNLHNGELGAVTDTDNDKQFDNTEWLKLEGDLADFYNQKYGNPDQVCVDNLTCKDYTLEQQYQLINLDCGVYKVKRRYRARDWGGNVSAWAEQQINVQYRPDWEITLPVDWIGSCGDAVPEAELLIDNGACDQMSYEVYDQQFDVVNNACFKVIRTYHIINWCKYKAGDDPIKLNRIANASGDVMTNRTISSEDYANGAYFTYVQILKVIDNTVPTIDIAQVDSCISGVQGCKTLKTFSVSGSDCNEASSNTLVFQWEVFENEVLKGNGTGTTFSWEVAPAVNYKVRWKVADRCGNTAWEERTYVFKDCVKPTPYCLHGLSIELGTSEEVAIWASDFDKNSFDNCTDASKLDLRIWHASLEVAAPTNLEEVQNLPTSIDFTCAYKGTQQVHIYVIDEAGNYDFCNTYVQVQDNMNSCPTTGEQDGLITGRIYTENGSTVQDVEVRVVNMDNASMMTSADGNYTFDLSGNESYTVAPKKNNNLLNGVSTFDLVKITKHILNKKRFTSPYQYIAADVNASGDISTFDIILLRKLILNLSDEFPDNTSWRFIDAAYEFTTDEPLKEDFPEEIIINNLSETLPSQDFIAVKIGDINGSVVASKLMEAENRNKEGNLVIEIENRAVKAGELVEIDFKATDFEQIEGYQFSLAFEDLALIEFKEGIAKAGNFNFNLQNRGFLSTSWNITSKEKVTNAALFRLVFEANKDGMLKDLIRINSKITAAEAYRTDGALLGVMLQAKNKTTTFPSFELLQNRPNPFSEQTIIPFELPQTMAVELLIMDMQGRIIQQQQNTFEPGLQQFIINANDLQSGTYYYQIKSALGVQTKKMTLIE